VAGVAGVAGGGGGGGGPPPPPHQPGRELSLGQRLSENERQQYQEANQPKLHQSGNQSGPLLVGLNSASGFHQAVFKHAESPRGTMRLEHWTPGLLFLLPKNRKIFRPYTKPSGPIL
jgi:hypothetical protein